MKLLLDEMLSPEIARQLRVRTHDVVAVSERKNLRGASDPEIFEAAQSEQRVIVTEDIGGFVRLDRLSRAAHRAHVGLVMSGSRRFRSDGTEVIGYYVRALDALLKAHPAPDALRDRIVWLK